MAESSDDNGTTTIETKWGKITGKKTTELIMVFSLCLLGVMAWILWEHKIDDRSAKSDLAAALREMTGAAKEGVQAQREMNCLISLPQDMREKQASFCKNISR